MVYIFMMYMNNNKQILIEVKDKLKSLIREVLLEENWDNWSLIIDRTEEINESINNTAGVEDTDEKFKDGSDFRIKFKVSDVIDLAKNKSIKEIDPKDINYDFRGRDEDSTKTKDRVTQADLSYPIIVVKNEKGKIFTILDGTHRLQKALNLNLDKIKTKILDKEELIQFKTNKL